MTENTPLLHLIGSAKMASGWLLVLSVAIDALAIGIGGRRRWLRALGDAAYANIFSFLIISVFTIIWAKALMPRSPISFDEVLGSAPQVLVFLAFTAYALVEAAIELFMLNIFFGYDFRILRPRRQALLYIGSNAVTAWLMMLVIITKSF